MKKITAWTLSLVLLLAGSSAWALGKENYLPMPQALAPNEIAELGQKPSLEFRWSSEGDRSKIRHYDFRLYKGSNAVEAALILHEEVPSGRTSFEIPANQFEAGQTYTWSIKQVGRNAKSRVNYTVFTVRK